MRIVIDGDNFAGLVIPTPHPKDKPTFILYLFATQLSGETPKRTATQSPSFFSALLCTQCYKGPRLLQKNQLPISFG